MEQYSKRIADYIYDDMDSEERLSFEQDLKTDDFLAREYKFQMKLVNYLKGKTDSNVVIEDSDIEEADRAVDEHMLTHPEDFVVTGEDRADYQNIVAKPGKSLSMKRILYPVVVAAAVFAGIVLVLNLNNEDLGTRLYNRYYVPMNEMGINTRGMNEQLHSEFSDALDQYRVGNYRDAAARFTQILNVNPEIDEAVLFLGLSRMGEERYSDAVKFLNDYLFKSGTFHHEASWYLALCYLKLEQTENSLELLMELGNIEGEFGKEASSLLKRVNRLK